MVVQSPVLPRTVVLQQTFAALRALARLPLGIAGLVIVGVMVAMALAAPLLPLPDPLATDIAQTAVAPGAGHLFGTDLIGRDVAARVAWGARSSLAIGVSIVVIGVAGGTILGLVAGFFSGTLVEEVVLRLIDVFAAIPLLIWAIAIAGIFGPGPVTIAGVTLPGIVKLVVLIGILFMPGIARITHALTLGEARAEYVDARKLQGAGPAAIMFGDILPNIVSPLIVQASVLIGIGIIIEASLSFIGLGVQPPNPSWGGMLSDAKDTIYSGEWWISLFPGLAIFLSVVGFNFLGDAMRTVLDPRRSATLAGRGVT